MQNHQVLYALFGQAVQVVEEAWLGTPQGRARACVCVCLIPRSTCRLPDHVPTRVSVPTYTCSTKDRVNTRDDRARLSDRYGRQDIQVPLLSLPNPPLPPSSNEWHQNKTLFLLLAGLGPCGSVRRAGHCSGWHGWRWGRCGWPGLRKGPSM